MQYVFRKGLEKDDSQKIKNRAELKVQYQELYDLLRKHGAKTAEELKVVEEEGNQKLSHASSKFWGGDKVTSEEYKKALEENNYYKDSS